MPNEIKLINSPTAPKQEHDNTSVKKARDGAMTFMVWSVAGTVLAACSFSFDRKKSADSDDSSDGRQGELRDGPVPNAPLYINSEGSNEGYDEGTDRLLGITDENGGGVSLATLVRGDVLFADVNGAYDFATARTLSGVWKSLPYDGSGDLLISPLTDLLARQLDADPNADIQEMLNQIFGAESGVTLDDIENPDNYNPVGLDLDDPASDVPIARKLISVAAIVRADSTHAANSGDAFTELTGQFSAYRGRLTDGDDDNNEDLSDIGNGVAALTDAADRPIVLNPNGGNPVSIREGTPTALLSSDTESAKESLFGFEDPLGDDSLMGIYIQDQSVDSNIAVMFGTTASNAALAGATRGAPPSSFNSMRTIGSETFYFVSAENLSELVLVPNNGDFNTDPEGVDNPQIRFYVFDGDHATIDNDGTALNGVGMLEIVVANVNDVPVVTPPTGTIPIITSSTGTLPSGTFAASDVDGDTDFTWRASGDQTYGSIVFGANGAWRFVLNEAAFNGLGDGVNAEATFMITAVDRNGGVSDPVSLTITLRGAADDSGSEPPSPVNNGEAVFEIMLPSGRTAETLVAGDELTVSEDSADPDGPGTYSYQWQNDGNNITDATGATYRITGDDLGDPLTVIVTYTDGEGFPESVTSQAVTVGSGSVVDMNRQPVLDALTGATITDNADSTTGSTVTTGLLTGVFTEMDADGGDTHTFSVANAVADSTTLSGFTHRVNGTYGMLFYNEGTGAYEYVRDEATINGLGDVSMTDTFSVTATDNSGASNDTSEPSVLTFTIVGADENPVTAAVLEIGLDDGSNGFTPITPTTTLAEDVVLRVRVMTADPQGDPASFPFRWQNDGTDITGATGGTYTITADDLGDSLTVVASYIDRGTNPDQLAMSQAVMVPSSSNVGDMNTAPTASISGDGAVAVSFDAGGATDPAIISFDDTDTDDLNSGLIIRGIASGDPTSVPNTPVYADGVGTALIIGDAVEVAGEYGSFFITRDDDAGRLSVTYDLNQDTGPVMALSRGGNLFEKLTVYVHDDEAASAAQDFVVTIEGNPTGYYHLPATGQVTVQGADDYLMEQSRSEETTLTGGQLPYSVSISNAPPTRADGLDRVDSTTNGGNDFRFSVNRHGEWEAIPIAPLQFVNSGSPNQAERTFYLHSFGGSSNSNDDHLGATEITVRFNEQVVVDLNAGDSGGASGGELYFGTRGDDTISETKGGTDVILARGGDDRFQLGRNDPDIIYHRFTSSGTDWSNTDGGDTITNYVRGGSTVSGGTDTFIFVDTDASSRVSESDFIASNNIRLYADVTGSGDDLTITGFEIRFVDPDDPTATSPAVESTISIDYHTSFLPVTDAGTVDDFGLGSVPGAGTHEVTDHLKWGHYFGTDDADLQVVGGLPSYIDTVARGLDDADAALDMM